MKAPIPLPFVKRGEEVPPSGVRLQAVLGFLLPFILIFLTALIAWFVIRAGIEQGAESEPVSLFLMLYG